MRDVVLFILCLLVIKQGVALSRKVGVVSHSKVFRRAPTVGLHASSMSLSPELPSGSLTAETASGSMYGGGGDGDDDPDAELIRRIEAEVMAESGVKLDQLINPSKVVNLERDLISLSAKLASCTDSEERAKLESKLEKSRSTLAVEKRAVMRGWLKNLFVGQSVLAAAISYVMVYDMVPGTHLALPLQVLGFWMWWLFIIPSLRARKPSNEEKDALNIAFLASPAVSLAMPVITKDVAIIWWVNAVTVAACYAYAYTKSSEDRSAGAVDEDGDSTSLPPLVAKALKALDYGSGQERGARK